MRSIFVSGEPVSLAAGASLRATALEELWKSRIREALSGAEPTPKSLLMLFAVESWLRHGQHFDLNNLTPPVFEAIYGKKETDRKEARKSLVSWRATVALSTTPFLLLDFADEVLLPLDLACDCKMVLDASWLGTLPADSRAGDRGLPDWVRKNMGSHVPSDEHRFGLHLVFSNKTRSVTRPADPPIKTVVDCLYPIFGRLAGSRGGMEEVPAPSGAKG
jgi:hypothetical protein